MKTTKKQFSAPGTKQQESVSGRSMSVSSARHLFKCELEHMLITLDQFASDDFHVTLVDVLTMNPYDFWDRAADLLQQFDEQSAFSLFGSWYALTTLSCSAYGVNAWELSSMSEVLELARKIIEGDQLNVLIDRPACAAQAAA